MSPREFLLDELENVSNILNESLRHDYTDQTHSFYNELNRRLRRVRQSLRELDDTDYKQIESKSKLVSELSTCISLIERSHLGEFSWEFASNFRKLAEKICIEPSLAAKYGKGSANRNPIFHISSQGGLSSYKIIRDTESLLENGRNRIFNIVFPRTLKPHVLLHIVIGHELCHAALDIPGHSLANTKRLLQQNVFGDDGRAVAWMRKLKPTTPDFVEQRRNSYALELLCDLVAFILMGPSYVSALSSFLSAIDPEGCGTEADKDTHPPYFARLAVLQHVMRLRRLSRHGGKTKSSIEPESAHYYEQLNAMPVNMPSTLSPFSDDELGAALDAITTALGAEVCFDHIDMNPLPVLLRNLRRGIPPSGCCINAHDKKIELLGVDFRLILYAGWIYWSEVASTGRIKFLDVNRLCEKGLLHQIAVEKMLRSNRANHGNSGP